MKRSICILISIILTLTVFLPISAHAAEYQPSETDISISVDDSRWYVFTRDNIENNPELDELGVTYESMYDTLYNNDAYLYAVLFYEDGIYIELLVRKKAIDSDVVNLSNYDDDEVLEFANEIAKKQNAEDYSVYKNQYKFAKLEYTDSSLGSSYYICEYITIVNKDNYTFTLQSSLPFTDSEHDEFKDIVDSAEFDVDTSLKEKKNSSFWSSVITKAIGGAVVGGVAGGVIALISKKRKNNKNNEVDSIGNEE